MAALQTQLKFIHIKKRLVWVLFLLHRQEAFKRGLCRNPFASMWNQGPGRASFFLGEGEGEGVLPFVVLVPLEFCRGNRGGFTLQGPFLSHGHAGPLSF